MPALEGGIVRNLVVTTLILLSNVAVLPLQGQLFDTLHQALSAATKETGQDKELDLTAIDVMFRVKFNDVEKPEHGGKAHVKFPGSRFIRNAPFDDEDRKLI